MKLTQKQERFTRFLFDGLSQRGAWVKAGYSNKYAVKIIDENACRLAAESKIKARLAELNKEADDDSVATKLKCKQRLSEIIRANVPDFVTDGEIKIAKDTKNVGAVAELETRSKFYKKTGEALNITKFKLLNPVDAIEGLAKLEGWYAAQPTINQDNRQLNIYVVDGETKNLIAQIKERTGKLIEG